MPKIPTPRLGAWSDAAQQALVWPLLAACLLLCTWSLGSALYLMAA